MHDHLDEAGASILALAQFLKDVRQQIWSNNSNELLNRQIYRRTDVGWIFPYRDAITRLVGAGLAEQTEDGQKGDVILGWRSPATDV